MTNATKPYGEFVPLFNVVIQEVGIVAASVYGRVWRYCQMDEKICSSAIKKIAKGLNLSQRTILRWLKELCKAGYLEDTTPERRNRPHRYCLTDKVPKEVRDAAKTEDQSATPERHADTDREAVEYSLQDSNEEKDPPKEIAQDDDGVFPTDSHVLGEKKIAKPNKPRITSHKTYLGMVAAVSEGRGGVPDWAVLGPEGIDPYYGVLLGFCELTRQSPPTGEEEGKGWLDKLSKIAEHYNWSIDVFKEGMRGLAKDESAVFFLKNNVWDSPYSESFPKKVSNFLRRLPTIVDIATDFNFSGANQGRR